MYGGPPCISRRFPTVTYSLLYGAAAELDFPRRVATVQLGTATINDLLTAVATCGTGRFRASVIEPEKVQLQVEGMKCMANCGNKVKASLMVVPGVQGEPGVSDDVTAHSKALSIAVVLGVLAVAAAAVFRAKRN